jgi:hypothetical protein
VSVSRAFSIHDLEDLRQRTAALHGGEAVPRHAGDEDDDGEAHHARGGGEPPVPALVLLDIHEHRDADGAAGAEAKQQPVEAAGHLQLLLGVLLVELVGAVRRQGRLDARRADGDEVQRQVEVHLVAAVHPLARRVYGVAAGGRLQPVGARLQHQQQEPLQETPTRRCK